MTTKPSRKKVKAIPIPRTETVSTRFTKNEMERVDKNAKNSGRTRAQYVRDVCLGNVVQSIPHAYQIAATLHTTHQTINELKKVIDIDELQDEVSKLVLSLKSKNKDINKDLT